MTISEENYFGRVTGQQTYTISSKPRKYESLPLDLTNYRTASNLSIEFINLPAQVSFLNDKFHQVVFVRSSVHNADEVYFVGDGAVYEEHNKGVGFMSCSFKQDFSISRYNYSCTKVTSLDIKDSQISKVLDFFVECGSVLIIASDRRTENSSLILYNSTTKAMKSLITFNRSLTHDLSCSGQYVLLITYLRSSTPVKLYRFDRGV